MARGTQEGGRDRRYSEGSDDDVTEADARQAKNSRERASGGRHGRSRSPGFLSPPSRSRSRSPGASKPSTAGAAGRPGAKSAGARVRKHSESSEEEEEEEDVYAEPRKAGERSGHLSKKSNPREEGERTREGRDWEDRDEEDQEASDGRKGIRRSSRDRTSDDEDGWPSSEKSDGRGKKGGEKKRVHTTDGVDAKEGAASRRQESKGVAGDDSPKPRAAKRAREHESRDGRWAMGREEGDMEEDEEEEEPHRGSRVPRQRDVIGSEVERPSSRDRLREKQGGVFSRLGRVKDGDAEPVNGRDSKNLGGSGEGRKTRGARGDEDHSRPGKRRSAETEAAGGDAESMGDELLPPPPPRPDRDQKGGTTPDKERGEEWLPPPPPGPRPDRDQRGKSSPLCKNDDSGRGAGGGRYLERGRESNADPRGGRNAERGRDGERDLDRSRGRGAKGEGSEYLDGDRDRGRDRGPSGSVRRSELRGGEEDWGREGREVRDTREGGRGGRKERDKWGREEWEDREGGRRGSWGGGGGSGGGRAEGRGRRGRDEDYNGRGRDDEYSGRGWDDEADEPVRRRRREGRDSLFSDKGLGSDEKSERSKTASGGERERRGERETRWGRGEEREREREREQKKGKGDPTGDSPATSTKEGPSMEKDPSSIGGVPGTQGQSDPAQAAEDFKAKMARAVAAAASFAAKVSSQPAPAAAGAAAAPGTSLAVPTPAQAGVTPLASGTPLAGLPPAAAAAMAAAQTAALQLQSKLAQPGAAAGAFGSLGVPGVTGASGVSTVAGSSLLGPAPGQLAGQTAGITTAGSQPAMTLEEAASLAARKAAELINRSMGVPGSMTADEKKKLLWGKKAGAAGGVPTPAAAAAPTTTSPTPVSIHVPAPEAVATGATPLPSPAPAPGTATGTVPAAGAAIAVATRAQQAGEGAPLVEGVPLVSPVAGGANHWERARFGDEATKSKFAKLMGVKPTIPTSASGAGAGAGAGAGGGGGSTGGALSVGGIKAVDETNQQVVQEDLERLYVAGLRRRDGRTVGLGL